MYCEAETPQAVAGLVGDCGGLLDGVIDLTGYESAIERAFYATAQVRRIATSEELYNCLKN